MAAVSAKGVVTAVGTGSTSIIVSNGTATASVTVIVNQSTTSSSGSSSDNSATQPEQQVKDPVVQAIQDAEKPELTLPQSEVRTLTTEMLNALHDTGAPCIWMPRVTTCGCGGHRSKTPPMR